MTNFTTLLAKVPRKAKTFLLKAKKTYTIIIIRGVGGFLYCVFDLKATNILQSYTSFFLNSSNNGIIYMLFFESNLTMISSHSEFLIGF